MTRPVVVLSDPRLFPLPFLTSALTKHYSSDARRAPLQLGMPERLKRLERLFTLSPIYFVTASTHQRAKILATACIQQTLEQFAQAGTDHGAWLGAYILMPDHLHLFVSVAAVSDRRTNVNFTDGRRPPLQGLPSWIKALKGTLSKTLRESGVESPHWQKGYFDHVLRSEESYSQKWHYVRENPVRAGLVSRWEDWPYWGEPYPLERRPDALAL